MMDEILRFGFALFRCSESELFMPKSGTNFPSALMWCMFQCCVPV